MIPVGSLARGRTSRLAASLAGAGLLALAAPAIAVAHSLGTAYVSRLPLAVYLAGAAATVALSFGFVLLRDIRAERPVADSSEGSLPPAPLRLALRAIGLIAWLWVGAQGIVGGTSNAEVATLFIWVFGWVGTAALSAIVGPAWHFLDPFSTLHDIGAAIVRRLGVPWDVAEYPDRLARWPAVIGFVVVVWLELVLRAGPQALFVVLVGYTAFTLAMMAQFGRDTWRSNAEVFTVWFRLLGRLAPYALADEAGRVRRRSFASGLLEPGWTRPDVVLAAFGVGSILYDGLSQTQIWYDLFGLPSLVVQTGLLTGLLGIIVLAALAVTRSVGTGATGAGLLPIAVGYLVAHYLTYVLIDGQRIVIAASDPFQRGWDLFGTAFLEPSGDWLAPSLVWTVQLAVVVGGHMLGAWGGHVVAALDAPAAVDRRSLTLRQVPRPIVMVALTTLTLWSLGQAIVVSPEEGATGQAVTTARG